MAIAEENKNIIKLYNHSLYSALDSYDSFLNLNKEIKQNYFYQDSSAFFKYANLIDRLPAGLLIINHTSFISLLDDFFDLLEKNDKILFFIINDIRYFADSLSKYCIRKEFFTRIYFIFPGTSIDEMDKILSSNLRYLSSEPGIIDIKVQDGIPKNDLLDSILTKVNHKLSDLKTYQTLIYKQIENTMKNYIKMSDTFAEFPATPPFQSCVFFSAGYSAGEADPHKVLSLQKQGIPVICVDTVLPFLMKNGIFPEFVIALDSQILNYYDFLYINEFPSIIIADISCNAKIIEKYYPKNRIIYFSSVLKGYDNTWVAPNLLTHFMIMNSNLAKIPGYGNVTLLGLSFALYFFQKIFVLGFDRGFDSMIYHCKESLDYRYYMQNSSYVTPCERSQLVYTLKKSFPSKKSSFELDKNKEIFKNEFRKYTDRIVVLAHGDDLSGFFDNNADDSKKDTKPGSVFYNFNTDFSVEYFRENFIRGLKKNNISLFFEEFKKNNFSISSENRTAGNQETENHKMQNNLSEILLQAFSQFNFEENSLEQAFLLVNKLKKRLTFQ